MAFDSFSIRRIADNTRVDINDVDRIVCEEFGLEFSDKDYGHFYFTESKEELGTFQKSISWAGLLHTIVYYSSINYGKSSTYDIEAAMAWISEYAIHFPHSSSVFTTKLVQFFKQQGLYVFVNFHRDEDRNREVYENTYNGYRIYRNKSGVFECDNDGKLLRFYPDKNNLLDEAVVRERFTSSKDYYKPCVHSLIIPEGVTSFDEEFFRYGLVENEFYLPKTLHSIGTMTDHCVFANTCLPDMVIPENVRCIGNFAFGSSAIKSVRITKFTNMEYLRQFADAHIETVYLPHEYKNAPKEFGGWVYLQNANNVEWY